MRVRTKKVILFALWLVIVFPVFGMILESYNRQKSSGETAKTVETEHNEHLL